MRQLQSLKPSSKYEIINSIDNYPISKMCKIAKVSKSGYYKWLNNKERISFQKILEYTLVKNAFLNAKGVKGIRRIKMELEDTYGMILNRKKISKIMKELHLKTKTRKKNPYKQNIKENSKKLYCDNLLQRNFKDKLPYRALAIDITYLKYNNRFAYLCILLDVKTTEIISYALSQTMTKELAIKTVEESLETLKKYDFSVIIHSDRGSQFTSKDYADFLSANGLIQSMSNPASPRDNAVIESFFGHLKDELSLIGFKTFEQVASAVDNYLSYYNNQRKQWSKNKMTPVEYREMLLAS